VHSGCGKDLILTKVVNELHKSISGLSEAQKQRLLDMKIICIEGSEYACTQAKQYVGQDDVMRSRVTIIHGLSTDPAVLERVRDLINAAGVNAYVLGPLAELLGSFATCEASELIFRSLSEAFPDMRSFPAPSRYATVSAAIPPIYLPGVNGFSCRSAVLRCVRVAKRLHRATKWLRSTRHFCRFCWPICLLSQA